MFTVTTMGGRVLQSTSDFLEARRAAHDYAARLGRYVEVHEPNGHIEYVYPARTR